MKRFPCSTCGNVPPGRLELAMAADAASRERRVGDILLCGACGLVSVYEADGQWRPATDAEIRAMPPEIHEAALKIMNWYLGQRAKWN